MNEVEQFLTDTNQDPNKVDVLEASLVQDGSEKSSEGADRQEDSDDEMKPKNRRERRLLKALQAEREGSIFLAGKLEAREDARSALTEEEDYLKAVERIYGTETPEAQLATDLLKKAITGARDDAERRAIERYSEREEESTQAESEANDELDDMIDSIEEENNFNFTQQQETAFFRLLQRMSPKDRDGNVIEYADPEAVWDVFQDKLKNSRTDNRAKDMSSRSMTQSGSSVESNLNNDVHSRFLRENGII